MRIGNYWLEIAYCLAVSYAHFSNGRSGQNEGTNPLACLWQMGRFFKNMTKEEREKFRKAIRNLAVKIADDCHIQKGDDGQTYPCGTCFCSGLSELISEKSAEYKEHNPKPDRINEVWRFLLQLRDEKY